MRITSYVLRFESWACKSYFCKGEWSEWYSVRNLVNQWKPVVVGEPTNLVGWSWTWKSLDIKYSTRCWRLNVGKWFGRTNISRVCNLYSVIIFVAQFTPNSCVFLPFIHSFTLVILILPIFLTYNYMETYTIIYCNN